MAGIKKFASIEEAMQALGITELTDANREYVEALVRKSAPAATSKTRQELMKLAESVDLKAGDKVVVNGTEYIFDPKKESVKSFKILLAYHMRNNGYDEQLQEFLENNGWAFSEIPGDDRLYELKKKQTPLEERELPKEGTVGYKVMEILGREEYANMEYDEIVEALAKHGISTTAKSVAFYDTFARIRKDDCAEYFGDGWEYRPRPSALRKKYGKVLDIEVARQTKPRGRKKGSKNKKTEEAEAA